MTDHDRHPRTQTDPMPGGGGHPQRFAGRDSKKGTYTLPMFPKAEKMLCMSTPNGPSWVKSAWFGEHVWRSGVGTPEGLI